MVMECIMAPVKDETDEAPQVPPGFVSLKSFTLQRLHDSALASTSANDPVKAMMDSKNNAADAVKLRKSLRHRPCVNYCQFGNSSDEEELDSESSDQDTPSICHLPKGVIRGCSECENCQKVIARWRPEGSSRPILDEAPVFYPSEEEFKDTLKYISSVRSMAEPYGICRIVPPPSWKPSCPLNEKQFWERSTFTTRIQRVDKLQNRDTLKKESTNRSIMQRKRRRLLNMRAACRQNYADISETNETGSYSQRFGFAQGPEFSLELFQKYADYFKEQYFCNGLNANLGTEKWEPSIENIEGEYWRIVEHPTDEIEVLYGADVETGAFGSGFAKASSATPDSDSDDWYARSGWNLNNVPRLPGSVLAFESGNISGVLVPWLYVGMCFSSFCWHVEDHHLYSVNYVHWGAPKVWYGVPGREALHLENAMKKHLAELFEEQPNLLHNLVTQFSPSILKLESVPVYRCIQQPGEFVITFPRAYHSGFNCGFNCAEAVNIAPVDWLPHGHNAAELYREQMRKITISHDKLLLGAAREAVKAQWNILFLKKGTYENQIWKDISGPDGVLAKSLKARVELERARREYLSSSQIRKMDSAFDADNERECAVCHYDLHLSAAGCPCSSDRFACLIHAKHMCSCDWKTRFFLFRYEIGELNILIDAVSGKLSAVHKWGLQDLKLSLRSYVNKEKSSESKSTSQAYSITSKENNKVSLSRDSSVSSKNTTSMEDPKASILQTSTSAVLKNGDSSVSSKNTTSMADSKASIMQISSSTVSKNGDSSVSSKNTTSMEDPKASILQTSSSAVLKNGDSSVSSKNTTSMADSKASIMQISSSTVSKNGDSSVSSKNPTSMEDPKASILQTSSSAISKYIDRQMMVDSTLVNDSALFQQLDSAVPSAAESDLLDNSILKVGQNHNLQTVEACIHLNARNSEECVVTAKLAQMIESPENCLSVSSSEPESKLQRKIHSGMSYSGKSSLASREDALQCNIGDRSEQLMHPKLGKGKRSAEEDTGGVMNSEGKITTCNSQKKQVPVPSMACPTGTDQERDDGRNGLKNIVRCLHPSPLDIKEQGKEESSVVFQNPPIVSVALGTSKEVGEHGTKSFGGDQKQLHFGSTNSNVGCKAGKVNEPDSSNIMRDKGEPATVCSSFPMCSVDRQTQMHKGPRMAKVVRRINCNVEVLEHGSILSGRLWSTSQAIFPIGYRSRVRYWSILDPTQMCYYISEILDAGLLGPLYMVQLEQSPSEVFFHVCATKCWDMVRERVNDEIRRLHNTGKVNVPSLQPPGSVDGLEMFGLTSPKIIQAIEAIDHNRVCSEYWRSQPKVSSPSKVGDQTVAIKDEDNEGLHLKSVLPTADAKLKALFRKASSEELHALWKILRNDQPGAKLDLVELIREENRHRLGCNL